MCFPLFHNPHLSTRPDRADPAVCFVVVGGWVFRPLLSHGKRGPIQADFSSASSSCAWTGGILSTRCTVAVEIRWPLAI